MGDGWLGGGKGGVQWFPPEPPVTLVVDFTGPTGASSSSYNPAAAVAAAEAGPGVTEPNTEPEPCLRQYHCQQGLASMVQLVKLIH